MGLFFLHGLFYNLLQFRTHKMNEMAAKEDKEMSLDDFRRWTVENLKVFLRKRGLSLTGKKEDLAARAFSANELKTPVLPNADQIYEQSKKDYFSILQTHDGETLPDPFKIPLVKWIGEIDGVSRWPPTMYYDIAEYILQHVSDRDLGRRIMSDYKEGKAFSYYKSGWLREMFYFKVPSSRYCFLMTECVPSEKIRHIPHQVYVIIEQDTGRIEGAYCTCFAGLGQTCNHVAALLFKVDDAWRRGVTYQACTSLPCLWNKFGSTKDIAEPRRVKDMAWKRHHYNNTDEDKVENPTVRQLFIPHAKKDKATGTTQKLQDALAGACPGAVLFKTLKTSTLSATEGPGPDVGNFEEITLSEEDTEVTWSLQALASQHSDVSSFLAALPCYTDSDIANLEKATQGQAANENWVNLRKGRLTGSIIHNVHTKVETLKSNTTSKSKNVTSLLTRIMGYKSVGNLHSLQHGLNMEGEAKQAYTLLLKKAKHKNIHVQDCGLFVVKDTIYISASPDALVSCTCCGNGLVEIKCPSSVRKPSPVTNVGYLQRTDNDDFRLKETCQYFTQVQSQMAATGRLWCDFFVYTRHSVHLERIVFNENKWNNVLKNAKFFFETYVAPELVYEDLQKSAALEVDSDWSDC